MCWNSEFSIIEVGSIFLPVGGDLALRILSPKEVDKLIGVQQSTIYQWTYQGFIPHVKIGKLDRFKVEDVMKWLSKMKSKGHNSRRIGVRELSLK